MSKNDQKKKIQNAPKTVTKPQQAKLSEDMVFQVLYSKTKSKMLSIFTIHRRRVSSIAIISGVSLATLPFLR